MNKYIEFLLKKIYNYLTKQIKQVPRPAKDFELVFGKGDKAVTATLKHDTLPLEFTVVEEVDGDNDIDEKGLALYKVYRNLYTTAFTSFYADSTYKYNVFTNKWETK